MTNVGFGNVHSKSQSDRKILVHDKLKYFVETFTPYKQILIFEERLKCHIWIFILDTHRAQINSFFEKPSIDFLKPMCYMQNPLIDYSP